MLQIRVLTNVSGQHGYQLPEREIEHAIEGWLFDCLKDGLIVIDNDQPTEIDGEQTFRASVECLRISANRNFYGVRAVRIFNPTTLELRVRPAGSDYRYPVFLVCPTPAIALTVLGRDRPDAMMYLGEMAQKLQEYLQLQIDDSGTDGRSNGHKSRQKKRPPRIRKLRQEDLVRNEISRPLALAHLSYLIQKHLDDTQTESVTGGDVVQMAITVINRTSITRESTLVLLCYLTDAGVIEPISQPGVQHFSSGVTIEEHAAWYVEHQRAEQRDWLRAQIDHCTRQLEQSATRQQQLADELQSERAEQDTLLEELDDFTAKLAAMKPD